MGSVVGCFAGFCHHCLATMSAHTHAYYYPLEGNLVCEQSCYTMYKRYITLHKYKEQQQNRLFLQ